MSTPANLSKPAVLSAATFQSIDARLGRIEALQESALRSRSTLRTETASGSFVGSIDRELDLLEMASHGTRELDKLYKECVDGFFGSLPSNLYYNMKAGEARMILISGSALAEREEAVSEALSRRILSEMPVDLRKATLEDIRALSRQFQRVPNLVDGIIMEFHLEEPPQTDQTKFDVQREIVKRLRTTMHNLAEIFLKVEQLPKQNPLQATP